MRRRAPLYLSLSPCNAAALASEGVATRWRSLPLLLPRLPAHLDDEGGADGGVEEEGGEDARAQEEEAAAAAAAGAARGEEHLQQVAEQLGPGGEHQHHEGQPRQPREEALVVRLRLQQRLVAPHQPRVQHEEARAAPRPPPPPPRLRRNRPLRPRRALATLQRRRRRRRRRKQGRGERIVRRSPPPPPPRRRPPPLRLLLLRLLLLLLLRRHLHRRQRAPERSGAQGRGCWRPRLMQASGRAARRVPGAEWRAARAAAAPHVRLRRPRASCARACVRPARGR
eukprot:scaffold1884_cov215-Prasinococcus_capsulatus_cf.AAC.1